MYSVSLSYKGIRQKATMATTSKPLSDYLKRLTTFVQSLPKSDVKFLYFIYDAKTKNLEPSLNTIAYEWKNPKVVKPLYVIPNKTVPIDYWYIYQENEIKYNVEDNKIVPYEKDNATQSYSEVEQTGGTLANWGNHLTIGFATSYKLRDPLMQTHVTIYGTDVPSRYQKYCNILVDSTAPTESSACIWEGKVMYSDASKTTPVTLLSTYQDHDYAIQVIKDIYDIVTTRGGHNTKRAKRKISKRTYKYNGKQYIVNTGQRGGTYINYNNTKKYIGGASWTNNEGFTDKFVKFLQAYVFPEISKQRNDLIKVYVVYDGSENIAIRYVFGGYDHVSESHFFIIDKNLFTQAYNAFMPTNTAQTAAFQEYVSQITQACQIAVDA